MIERTRRWIEGVRRLWRLQGRFARYLVPHRKRIALVLLLSLLYAGVRLLEPWPIQILFDVALLGKETTFLGADPLALAGGDRAVLVAVAALAVLVLATLSGAIYYVQNVALAGIGQEIVLELRKDLFHQMQRLALPFHRRASTGDLLMRLTGDMILLREMILASLVTLFTQVLLLVSILAIMLAINWRLTLVAATLAPLLALLIHSFRGRMVETARKQRRREGRLAHAIEEVLLSIPMIQAYTAERDEDERFRKLGKRSARAGLRGARLEAGMQRLVEIGVALGTCLVLWFGVRQVLDDGLTPGQFLVFLAYLRAVYKPIRGISKVTERTARASAAADRVFEVLEERREIRDSRDAFDAPPFRGEIGFDHVTFRYEDGTLALEDVTFQIQPGERVALVGPTGAGKSTLFSLILRFQDPTQGRVLIDGIKTKRYRIDSLRRQIGLLPQEPFLMSATIRENLLYGKPEATDAELWQALRDADIEELVRFLPDGLDTRVRSRGRSLSGGQQQRLAIARALLKNAPILLLDEPATGLDAESEAEVVGSLDRLRAGRTTLTIAHRFSTIRSATRVLVLESGRLVEEGTPEELLDRDGLFRFLSQIQGGREAERPERSKRTRR